MQVSNVETHRAPEGSDYAVNKHSELAFYITMNISLAIRMLENLRYSLINVSDCDVMRLREAEDKLLDAVRILGDVMDEIEGCAHGDRKEGAE